MITLDKKRVLEKLNFIEQGIKHYILEHRALRTALSLLVDSIESSKKNHGDALSVADALQMAKDTLNTIPKRNY